MMNLLRFYRLVRKLLMGMGAVALAVSLVSLVAPKAARALVATLVQVTNTTTNPVPSMDVFKTAAQMIQLTCLGSTCFTGVLPGGLIGPPENFTVPAGQSLILTQVEFMTNTGGGVQVAVVYVDPPPYSINYFVDTWGAPKDGQTHVFEMSPGVVIPAGSTLNSPAGFQITLRGYLTSN